MKRKNMLRAHLIRIVHPTLRPLSYAYIGLITDVYVCKTPVELSCAVKTSCVVVQNILHPQQKKAIIIQYSASANAVPELCLEPRPIRTYRLTTQMTVDIASRPCRPSPTPVRHPMRYTRTVSGIIHTASGSKDERSLPRFLKACHARRQGAGIET